MVELGLSGFALGLVGGWSMLFLRWSPLSMSSLYTVGLCLAWALLLYGLAMRLGMSPGWLAGGFGAGAIGHAMLVLGIRQGGIRR